jgi:hypothetical protein
MNKYRIITFSCGNSQETIVEAYDIVTALTCGIINQLEVVRIEFVGSSNKVDMTQEGP